MSQRIYACVWNNKKNGEQFVADHVLGYVQHGTLTMFSGKSKVIMKAGDFRFVRKNQLVKYTKHADENGKFNSISICLDHANLRTVFSQMRWPKSKTVQQQQAIRRLTSTPLMETFVNSLFPYLESEVAQKTALTDLKIQEAIHILLGIHPELGDVLFDFTTAGKIDLEAYMNAHYRESIKLADFAFSTGRSLATFKRDFKVIFHESPNQWLLKKRLTDAYFLIKEKQQRPQHIYKEVGFKNLSHFTTCFKRIFHCTPRHVRNSQHA